MAAQIELVQNDTRPKFGGSVAFDLSGYTVTMHIAFSTVLVKTATILTSTASSSTFEFEFVAGDLDVVAATYDFELQFDDGSDGITTYKKDDDNKILQIRIFDEIA